MAETLIPFFSPGATEAPGFQGPDAWSDSLRRANAFLGAVSDIDVKFSENRCSKALPQAFAVYKDGNQAHYSEEYHNAKVATINASFCLSINKYGFI